MTVIEKVRQAAEAALESLRQRARAESWDLERINREKQLFELSSEVTLCCKPGCLRMAAPIPGFREILCEEHERAEALSRAP